MNYFEVLYAKKNGAALPANFFDLLFAKSFTPAIEWGEYDGTLPATYSANGSMLADYRVYGSAGGVGDKTANLFDVSKIVTRTNKIRQENGTVYINLDATGTSTADGNNSTLRDLIGSVPPGTYRLSATTTGNNKYIYLYGRNEAWGFGINKTFTADKIDEWLDSVVLWYASGLNTSAQISDIMIANYSPTKYIPYGYKLDMSVSDGTTSTTTPIYIGDTPLGEDEYVDYGEGKVYRRTDNQFYGDFINGSLTQNGYIMSDTRIVSENYIKIDELQNTLSITPQIANLQTIVFYYDNNKTYLGASSDGIAQGWQSLPFTFSAVDSTKYARIVFRYSDNSPISPSVISNVMLNKGATAETYVPYLQPTDPPVPLPALPTFDGTTIVDYAGQSAAPSRFYAKYRKG